MTGMCPNPGPSRAGDGAAAFFDVDNTLIVGASMFHFARGLISRGYVSKRVLLGFVLRQLRFRLGGEHHGDIATARDSALEFVSGRTVAEIVRVSEEIYDEHLADRIWTGARGLAHAHLAAGEPVWLVTATPIELATVVATRLGLTGALGTRAEVRDGAYTGRLVDQILHGQAKADAVRALADREGLDLARCSAYSDSVNDLPLFELVGRPVAVNPDSRLAAEADLRGWEVYDFRSHRRTARRIVPIALGAVVVGAIGLGAVVLRRWRWRLPRGRSLR